MLPGHPPKKKHKKNNTDASINPPHLGIDSDYPKLIYIQVINQFGVCSIKMRTLCQEIIFLIKPVFVIYKQAKPPITFTSEQILL